MNASRNSSTGKLQLSRSLHGIWSHLSPAHHKSLDHNLTPNINKSIHHRLAISKSTLDKSMPLKYWEVQRSSRYNNLYISPEIPVFATSGCLSRQRRQEPTSLSRNTIPDNLWVLGSKELVSSFIRRRHLPFGPPLESLVRDLIGGELRGLRVEVRRR